MSENKQSKLAIRIRVNKGSFNANAEGAFAISATIFIIVVLSLTGLVALVMWQGGVDVFAGTGGFWRWLGS